MPEITDDDLIDMFGDRTYERGLDYYRDETVTGPMILGGVLQAEVRGTADEPYKTSVTIEGGDVFYGLHLPCRRHVQARRRRPPDLDEGPIVLH